MVPIPSQTTNTFEYAFELLSEHGELYAIVNGGWETKEQRKYVEFRDWLCDKLNMYEFVPRDTFETTSISTRILHLCKTKGEATYLEVKEQFTRNVLEDESYLNDNISGKFFRGRVKTWKERNDG